MHKNKVKLSLLVSCVRVCHLCCLLVLSFSAARDFSNQRCLTALCAQSRDDLFHTCRSFPLPFIFPAVSTPCCQLITIHVAWMFHALCSRSCVFTSVTYLLVIVLRNQRWGVCSKTGLTCWSWARPSVGHLEFVSSRWSPLLVSADVCAEYMGATTQRVNIFTVTWTVLNVPK